jgi:UrcA family protein
MTNLFSKSGRISPAQLRILSHCCSDWWAAEYRRRIVMKSNHALLAFVGMVAFGTAEASATTAAVPQSITIEAGDLDLGSSKGQRVLAMRIHRAARAMCKSEAVASLPRNIRKERECIRQAKASAEAAVKTLTAAAASKSGKDG